MSEAVRAKRFYKEAGAIAHEGRHAITLDGRMAKTMGRQVLSAPTLALACAVVDEWAGQGEHIDRQLMPLTGILSAAIDGYESEVENWRAEIVNYMGSDLVCYRAEAPQALAERQSEIWDPYVEFMRTEFGAILITTAGIMAVPQADASVAALRGALEQETPEMVFALQIATAISGSAVLALAMWKEFAAPEDIFEASRVDERFQEQRWGVDEEARAREEGLKKDFLTASRFLSLLKA